LPPDLRGNSSNLTTSETVGALVVANPVGSATTPGEQHFWAAPFEVGDEFGGRGWPHPIPANAARVRYKGMSEISNTTLAVVATDARLTKAEAKRLAVMAQP